MRSRLASTSLTTNRWWMVCADLSVVIIHPSAGANITSGGLAPLVAVMKSTDAGQCDDLDRGRRSRRDRSPVRCVLG